MQVTSKVAVDMEYYESLGSIPTYLSTDCLSHISRYQFHVFLPYSIIGTRLSIITSPKLSKVSSKVAVDMEYFESLGSIPMYQLLVLH